MKMYLCAALCLLVACDRPSAEPVPAISAALEVHTATPSAPAPAAPTPDRPMTGSEKALVGTWIATVGKDASTSKLMAGGALLGLGGGDLVAGVVDALENERTIPTNCIWVELRDDFTGQRCACALMNGEPSLLETTNIMTGAKSSLGGGLTWQMPEGGPLRITLEEAHVVPRTIDGVDKQLEFTQWHLKLLSSSGGELQVHESFPEHDFALAGPQTYEVFPGAFLSE
jgi:hypothetical protein